MVKIVLFILLQFIFLLNSFSQDFESIDKPNECKSDLQQEEFWKMNPEARLEYIRNQESAHKLMKDLRLKRTSGDEKYIIPVVFHVFGKTHNGKGVTFNLIEDALEKTNSDFSATSPGQNIDNINGDFKNVVDVLPIEFRLAKIDENGNFTTGVTFNSKKAGFGESSGYDNEIRKYAWDNYKYMNIYIMNDLYDDGDVYNSGVAWYPDEYMSNANTARIVYNGAFLGKNTDENFRRILTHEIGHFFDLIHTFSGGCPAGNGDFCEDTPEANNSSMRSDDENCHGELTNTQNFMNYSDDYEMFTQDQVARMKAALHHKARKTLWTEENLIATGTNDDFISSYDYIDENNLSFAIELINNELIQIALRLRESKKVVIELINSEGSIISEVVNEKLNEGISTIKFSTDYLANEQYDVVRISAFDQVIYKKIKMN